ncbi:MAG: UDP-N-acetylglucosamine 1-carboxyvinyltransferase [Alphaproteobacteria bacterium]|jgi:UDP-N-acetylglucosamine 1-carboxyvinyltransferase|nr:UDP-N-acetylglucosamine 1-carboxyvinyltransferase [Alphaproteobacteria bacterium]
MDRIRIRGGATLRGTIAISGAKNAALPLMAASLLTDQPLVLANIPGLVDIKTMADLLAAHGVAVSGPSDGELTLTADTITNTTADYELVRRMRASVLVLGPLLARFGRARVSLPGGCAIGTRPVDLHLAGLQAMGADIDIVDGYVEAQVSGGLTGAKIPLAKVSVGATENLMMAAALADGETVLENAATEPEIVDLGQCLGVMGADLEGLGTSRIVIRGQSTLGGGRHTVLPDRIEAGTFAMAAAATGGEVTLAGIGLDVLGATAGVMEQAGVELAATDAGILVRRPGPLLAVDVATAPYPGFATDMQAQLMALMATADGTSVITETIFENRFMHVPELQRMGADILVDGNRAEVTGVKALKGAQVMATDLRASVSLVVAGLIAQGETMVNRVYHLDRGYERLVEKLAACGADIARVGA